MTPRTRKRQIGMIFGSKDQPENNDQNVEPNHSNRAPSFEGNGELDTPSRGSVVRMPTENTSERNSPSLQGDEEPEIPLRDCVVRLANENPNKHNGASDAEEVDSENDLPRPAKHPRFLLSSCTPQEQPRWNRLINAVIHDYIHDGPENISGGTFGQQKNLDHLKLKRTIQRHYGHFFPGRDDITDEQMKMVHG
jgi:hypothetical protein